MNTPTQHAVVLFAHGSRDPLWHLPMEAVAAKMLQTEPDLTVRCAYLELSTPDLASACQSLVDQGVLRIAIVPLFLGVGRHVRDDLPELMTGLRAQHPAVLFELKAPVGEDPRLIQLLAQIAAEREK